MNVTKKERNQRRNDNIYVFLYQKSKRSFYDRDHIRTYTLTPDIIKAQYEKQNGLDYYTGLPFENKLDISIDRLDSTKGYDPDNIVLTRIVINKMKNNLSQTEFLDLINQIHSYQSSKDE